jgi:YD repeat-containing protein
MSLCALVAACNDNDNQNGNGTPVTATDDLSRVKSMSGYDAHYGNYTMSVHYGESDGKLDSMVIRDDANTRIGRVSMSESTDNTVTYTFTDIIAQENGPIYRTYKAVVVRYWRDAVQSQTFTTYRRKEGTTDYLLDSRRHYIYEYDSQGRIAICRRIDDVYDQEQGDDYYVRTIDKAETTFDGNRVGGMTLYNADGDLESETNYVRADSYTFNYTSGRLSSVAGTKLQMNYTYSDNMPSAITSNGQTVNYRYNADGLVTSISYPDGRHTEIAYEQGAGSLRLLSPLFDTLLGIPAVD